MKIVDLRCCPVQAPGRTFVIILVETDEGLVGVGEAGLQRRWRAIEGATAHLRQCLIGQDPMRIEHLWQLLFRGGFYPADRVIGSAISGIDIALWDIKGQVLGVPVYQLLGGRCRDHVEIFTNPRYLGTSGDLGDDKPPEGTGTALLDRALARGEPEAVAELARIWVAKGHRFFRLGFADCRDGDRFEPRQGLRTLLIQLRAVRDAVGTDTELMVDLHARLTPADAIWFCREAEPLDMFLVEDPIRSERPSSYRTIRQHVNVPLAAGEQWANKWEFATAIEEELIDFARVDICIAGGLTEGKKIAGMAETHYIQMLPHNPLGPVCTAASLHLDLACNNAGPQEVLFDPTKTLPDVFECAFEQVGNRLTVPDVPGIGVKFNEQAARSHPAEMTEPPHLQRMDGSHVNY
jgi:L-alanine-DL-glutamate epimerase-like enolase superfamily enzyme